MIFQHRSKKSNRRGHQHSSHTFPFLFKGLILNCPVSPVNWVAAYFVPRGTKSWPRNTVNLIPLSTHILSFIETNLRGCASNTLPGKEGYEFCLTNCALSLISTAKRSRQPAKSIWERTEGEKEGEEESSHFQSLFAPVLKDQKISFKRPVNLGLFFFELAQYCRWRCNSLQVLWLLDLKTCLPFPNFKQSLIQEFLDGFLSEIINISLTGS